MKTVKVGPMECAVETLSEWLSHRIPMLYASSEENDPVKQANIYGRIVELEIIKEKIDDGRIQRIR